MDLRLYEEVGFDSKKELMDFVKESKKQITNYREVLNKAYLYNKVTSKELNILGEYDDIIKKCDFFKMFGSEYEYDNYSFLKSEIEFKYRTLDFHELSKHREIKQIN